MLSEIFLLVLGIFNAIFGIGLVAKKGRKDPEKKVKSPLKSLCFAKQGGSGDLYSLLGRNH